MNFERYHYKTYEELKSEIQRLSVDIPLSENTGILKNELPEPHIKNRIAIQPMEGCDGTPDGKPDELTFRRYMRFARSGAGLIWGEATAVMKEGRANPRQLYINKDNLDAFKKLVNDTKEECMRHNGFEPYLVCQLTHSGRYAKPNGYPQPLIAYHNPIFEKDNPIDDSAIVSDDYLDSVADHFGPAAAMAKEAGFDAADVKCCHRYLFSELCSAYERPGKYGGSFENRTRLYLTALKNAMSEQDDSFKITSRLNLYDGFAYPNGFGVKDDGSITPDLDEPIKLVGIIHNDLGIKMLDFTIGNPYFNPHVNRPFDMGGYVPPEHPLEGVARMFDCIKALKKAYPDLTVISSGHSYLRKFAPNLAAAVIERGIADIAGFGREAFAYEQFANDILNGCFDEKKCCIACSKCTELMRAGTVAGCVVRDSEVYLPYYKQYCKK